MSDLRVQTPREAMAEFLAVQDAQVEMVPVQAFRGYVHRRTRQILESRGWVHHA